MRKSLKIIFTSLAAALICVGIIRAATTIGNNISTDGVLTATQKIGISTSSPYAMLSIAGASLGTTPLFTVSTSTASATTTVFHIDYNGNIGIGTTNPFSPLHVYSGDLTLSQGARYMSSANLGDFQYSLATKEYVWMQDTNDVKNGYFTFINSDDRGESASDVWGDGKFIYLANSGDGLLTYSVDSDGNLTFIDSDDQGESASDVWGDGKFIYLANSGGGLLTYSVDSDGNLTFIDSDDQGESARNVWGDGKFIYLANSGGGLATYSVDSDGNLTFIDSDDQGGVAYSVWGDGKFIYLANYLNLATYSVDSDGNLTFIDSDNPGGGVYDVWGDGKFIYSANNTNGLATYSVDSDGNLTFIDSDDQGGAAQDIWGDGDFIYLANLMGGLLSYSVDSAGILYNNNSIAINGAYGVWGDGKFIYAAGGGSGIRSYSINNAYSYAKNTQYHSFVGNVGIGTTTPYSRLSLWGAGTSGSTVFEVSDSASTTLFSILDNGKIGIATSSPAVELDVNGLIKTFQSASTTCSGSIVGSIFYNSDNDSFWGCKSSGWVKLDN